MPETDLIPQISLAERDRRYKLVREKMAAEGLDILLLPANTSRWEQTMADSRYLTGIGGFATEVLTIFPAEGPEVLPLRGCYFVTPQLRESSWATPSLSRRTGLVGTSTLGSAKLKTIRFS